MNPLVRGFAKPLASYSGWELSLSSRISSLLTPARDLLDLCGGFYQPAPPSPLLLHLERLTLLNLALPGPCGCKASIP